MTGRAIQVRTTLAGLCVPGNSRPGVSKPCFGLGIKGNSDSKLTVEDTLVHRLAAIVLCCFLLTTAGIAQIPTKGNVFFGYSYARADLFSSSSPLVSTSNHANLNGWNGSLEGRVLPWVGIVADISGLYGSQDFAVNCEVIPSPPCIPIRAHLNAKVHSFLFGPRVSVSVGKITPFAHALFGASHISASTSVPGFSDSDTSFATALGGGIDYRLIHGLGWRVQGDYLQTRFFSNTQNNFRLSTGLVLHF